MIVDIEVINIECSYSQSSLKKIGLKWGHPTIYGKRIGESHFPEKESYEICWTILRYKVGHTGSHSFRFRVSQG